MSRRFLAAVSALCALAAACGGVGATLPDADVDPAGATGTTVEPSAVEVHTGEPTGPDSGPDDGVEDPGPVSPPGTFVVAGDSISVALGTEMARRAGPGVDVEVIGVVGTGLAFPQAFDWPATLAEVAAAEPPDVVVFSVGSNDAADLVGADGEVVVRVTDDGWADEYRRRLARVVDVFADSGTEVWWVGQVCAARDAVCETNRAVHGIALDVAADRPWMHTFDLAEIFGSGEGPAFECLAADGVHLDADCVEVAARVLLDGSGSAR